MRAAYQPAVDDIVLATITTSRKRRDGMTVTSQREVFGAVQRVTPKRVLVMTLKTSFMGFSKNDVWIPAGTARPANKKQCARWFAAMRSCDDLVKAFRDAAVSP